MFGANLKAARKAKKLTQTQLAQQYNKKFNDKNEPDKGLNKGTISKYENGKSRPSYDVVTNLAYILDVPVSYLSPPAVSKEDLEYWEQKYNPNGQLANEVSTLDAVKKQYGKDTRDALCLYIQLDVSDQGEVRGEMKQMLKSDKYNK